MDILLIFIINFLIALLIYRPIARKAGFSGWWALPAIIPIVNIILLWVMAFTKWPSEEEKESLVILKDR